MSPTISTLYEDESFFVLNKPALLHSVDNLRTNSPSLAGLLRNARPELNSVSPQETDCGLVNRLDFETSGIVIVAQTAEIWKKLHTSLTSGESTKEYLALVEGSLQTIREVRGYIGSPYRRSKKMKFYPSPEPRALEAHATFEPIRAVSSSTTLVRIKSSSGRRHQMRVLAASCSMPLVGDSLYGARGDFKEVALKSSQEQGSVPPFFLHAQLMSFPHPQSGDLFTISAPLPWYASSFE